MHSWTKDCLTLSDKNKLSSNNKVLSSTIQFKCPIKLLNILCITANILTYEIYLLSLIGYVQHFLSVRLKSVTRHKVLFVDQT